MIAASLKEEEELALQVLPLQMGSTEAIPGHSGSSTLSAGLLKGPPVPCYIAILTILLKALPV